MNGRALHFPQTADTRCLRNAPFIIFVKGTAVMPPKILHPVKGFRMTKSFVLNDKIVRSECQQNVILSVSEVSDKPSPRGEGGLTVRSGRMRGTYPPHQSANADSFLKRRKDNAVFGHRKRPCICVCSSRTAKQQVFAVLRNPSSSQTGKPMGRNRPDLNATARIKRAFGLFAF